MRNNNPPERDKNEEAPPLPLGDSSRVVDQHGTAQGGESSTDSVSATQNKSFCWFVMLACTLGGGAILVLLLVLFLGDEEESLAMTTRKNETDTTTTADKNGTHPTQPTVLPNLPVISPLAPPTSPLWTYPDDSINWTTTVGPDCPFNAENAVPNRELLQRAIQFYFQPPPQQEQAEPFSNETTTTTPTNKDLLPYGWPIGTWCIGHENLTSLHSAFYRQPIVGDTNSWNETKKKNHSIEEWDVSRITDMRHVFQSATQFDQDLSTWNTERVQRLDFAFTHATAFNGDVTTWDTGTVTSMQFLFCDAEHFNQDLLSWNTSHVEFMGSMFLRAPSFTADLSAWNVENVRDMSAMFSQSSSSAGYWITGTIDPVFPPLLPGQTAWPTSAPTTVPTASPTATPTQQSLGGLIYGDISGWNVARVESFRDMFRDNTNFSLDLCAWGAMVRPDANVANMFMGTNCPESGDPNLTAIPPGPFCVPCVL